MKHQVKLKRFLVWAAKNQRPDLLTGSEQYHVQATLKHPMTAEHYVIGVVEVPTWEHARDVFEQLAKLDLDALRALGVWNREPLAMIGGAP